MGDLILVKNDAFFLHLSGFFYSKELIDSVCSEYGLVSSVDDDKFIVKLSRETFSKEDFFNLCNIFFNGIRF